MGFEPVGVIDLHLTVYLIVFALLLPERVIPRRGPRT